MKQQTSAHFIFSVPAILFLLVIIPVELMIGMYEYNVKKSARIDALEYATNLRAHAEAELSEVLHLTSGLSSYLLVRRDSLVKDEIEQILQIAWSTTQHVRNFGVAIGYKLAYIYPYEGNENAIGLDYRSRLDQWPAVEQAIASRQGVLDEQVKLVQGGLALIYREPIFINDEYWGLLSTVIDSGSFFQQTFGNMPQNNYKFSVLDSNNDLLWGDQRLFTDMESVIVSSDRGWKFAVKSAKPVSQLPGWALRFFGWALALALSVGTYNVLAHRRALAHLALHDPLTGLPNRSLLNDRIEHALQLAKRRPQEGVMLIFIDLDNFKKINDTYGHKVGDFVLVTIAQRIKTCARQGDTAARWAGDEFILLIENISEVEMITMMERIAKIISKPMHHEGQQVAVTASLGYAQAFTDASSAADLIWAADRRMYTQKADKKTLSVSADE